MGFEVIGLFLAGVAMGTLGFYMLRFIIDVIRGKYRTEK